MFKKQLLGAAIGSILVLAGADAGVIPNQFDSEHGGVGVLNYTGFADYTVSTGSVDLIGNGFYDAFAGNGLYVDLAGTTGQFGALTTNTVYGPGTYLVTIGLGGTIYAGVSDGAILSWNTGSIEWDLSGLDTASYSFLVTLTSASAFTVADAGKSGNANIGATLFGLSIDPAPGETVVPEPLTLSLMGAGLLGAFGLRRKRKSV